MLESKILDNDNNTIITDNIPEGEYYNIKLPENMKAAFQKTIIGDIIQVTVDNDQKMNIKTDTKKSVVLEPNSGKNWVILYEEIKTQILKNISIEKKNKFQENFSILKESLRCNSDLVTKLNNIDNKTQKLSIGLKDLEFITENSMQELNPHILELKKYKNIQELLDDFNKYQTVYNNTPENLRNIKDLIKTKYNLDTQKTNQISDYTAEKTQEEILF